MSSKLGNPQSVKLDAINISVGWCFMADQTPCTLCREYMYYNCPQPECQSGDKECPKVKCAYGCGATFHKHCIQKCIQKAGDKCPYCNRSPWREEPYASPSD